MLLPNGYNGVCSSKAATYGLLMESAIVTATGS